MCGLPSILNESALFLILFGTLVRFANAWKESVVKTCTSLLLPIVLFAVIQCKFQWHLCGCSLWLFSKLQISPPIFVKRKLKQSLPTGIHVESSPSLLYSGVYSDDSCIDISKSGWLQALGFQIQFHDQRSWENICNHFLVVLKFMGTHLNFCKSYILFLGTGNLKPVTCSNDKVPEILHFPACFRSWWGSYNPAGVHWFSEKRWK